jgi:multiple sugar transport system permease protein
MRTGQIEAVRPGSLQLLSVLGKVALSLLIVVGLFITLFPFLVSVSTSFKAERYALALPPTLWSPEWTLENYVQAWKIAGFSKYMLNTLIFASVTAVSATLTAALGGYTFSRMRFAWRNQLFIVVLATMMIPGSVTLIPLFYLMVHFPLVGGNNLLGQGGAGFYNSWGGLLLPGLIGPSSIFLMRQFFQTLPRELEDAARIDGSSEIGIFVRIMMPLAKPGLIVVFLFQFTDSWNAFEWPLVITKSPSMYTMQIGLQVFALPQQVMSTVASEQAAAVMTTLPILILFILGQRYFTEGIALTGLK